MVDETLREERINRIWDSSDKVIVTIKNKKGKLLKQYIYVESKLPKIQKLLNK